MQKSPKSAWSDSVSLELLLLRFRVSKVVNLSDDIALAIALSGSIEASDSGKLAIGIEVPIKEFAVVKLAQISTEQ